MVSFSIEMKKGVRNTNRLESYITENPFGESDECAKFVIDNVSNPFILHDVIEIGQQYTIGFWAKSEAEGNMAVQGVRIPLTTEWKRHVIVFKAKKENFEFLFEAVGTHYIFRTKLESGNKATDWMPSPEDTEAEITNIREITTTHTTQISTMQGQISALIAEDTIIKGDYDALVSRYNATVAEVDSIKTTIGEHTTLIDANTQDILAVSTKATTIETDLNGIKTRVIANETAIEKKADGTEVESLAKRVATSETAIEQNAGAIELMATKTEVGALESRLEASEASIIVHTKEIALTVKESDVTGDYLVSKINLSSTSATIEAKHINLIGSVTAECIATGAVTTDKLASKAVKAQNIDVEDLFAQKITATNMTIKGTSKFEGDVTANYLYAQKLSLADGLSIYSELYTGDMLKIYGTSMYEVTGELDGNESDQVYQVHFNPGACYAQYQDVTPFVFDDGISVEGSMWVRDGITSRGIIVGTDIETGEGISLTDMYEKMKPDYVKAYRSGSNITCSKSFSVIPLSVQAKYGDTFEFQSDGTILVKKSCHLDISAQVYFASGFTAGDWICAAICCNGNVNVRTGQYVDRANPYIMLNLSTKVSMDAGETISLVAMNETGARGTINTGVSDTFLHANVIAYT